MKTIIHYIITTVAILVLIIAIFALVNSYTKTNEYSRDSKVANHNLNTVFNLFEIQESTKYLSLKELSAKYDNNTQVHFKSYLVNPNF